MSSCIDKLLCDNSNGCVIRITDENGNDIETRFLTQGDIIYLSVGEREGFIFDHFVFREEGGTEVGVSTELTDDGRYKTTALCGGTYIAVFDIIVYNVEVNPNNRNYGTTSGGGFFKFGYYTTITATPEPGYHFVGWYIDNNLISNANVFNYLVKGDVIIDGVFEPNMYSILVKTNQPSLGTTEGTGMHGFNEVVTISATPNEGSSFAGWDNGETNNSFDITVLQSAIYVAEFKKITYTVNIGIECDDCTQVNTIPGFIAGQGVYGYGETVTIKAYPNEGFSFVKWRFYNGSEPIDITDGTYSFEIYDDYQFEAHFCIRLCSLDIDVSPNGSGVINYPQDITSGSMFQYGSNVTVTATATGNTLFSNWGDGDENPVKTFVMTTDINETAFFVPRPYYYTITIHFGNGGYAMLLDDNGTSIGNLLRNSVSARLIEGSTVTVTPIASENYEFYGWDDSYEGQDRTFTLQSNIDKTITFNHV